ncbi:MAG: sterol desaturase family protein [Pseudomonadota bacterium]
MTGVLTAITVCALAVLLLIERLAAAFIAQGGASRLLRNAGLGVLGLAATFLVVTPVSLAASEIGPAWQEGWPFAARLVTDLLILELYLYGWHRAMHEVPFLWRFHRVHHYDAFLDVTSAIRFHPGEVILSAFLRGVLIIGTDVSAASILLMDALVIIAAAFHHANLALPLSVDRVIRTIVVTPQHHRIHHHPERQYTDSNYGTLLTIWDRLFGSFKEREAVGSYGVEGAEERSLPALIIDPLRSR